MDGRQISAAFLCLLVSWLALKAYLWESNTGIDDLELWRNSEYSRIVRDNDMKQNPALDDLDSRRIVDEISRGNMNSDGSKRSCQDVVPDVSEIRLPDHSLWYSGGQVLATSKSESTSLISRAARVLKSVFLFGSMHRNPNIVLTPGVYPGQCFPFPGSTGYIVISARFPIYLKSITIDHALEYLLDDQDLQSSPKDLEVFMYDLATKSNQEKLAEFRFPAKGRGTSSAKNFLVTRLSDVPSRFFNISWSSNHGGAYTCIYRIRLHGDRA